MKTIALIALCVLAVASADDWKSYKALYGKSYNAKEEYFRRIIFTKNVNFINNHNAKAAKGIESFFMAVNQFTDLLPSEINKFAKGFRMDMQPTNTNKITHLTAANVELPKEVDWRKHGAVTPVKDQGACGSCWAFSATGTLEGAWFRKTGKLVSLSEEQIIDCTETPEYNMAGCSGGLPEVALEYIQKVGSDSEESYPYHAGNGEIEQCDYKKKDVAAKDKGVVHVAQSEQDLMDAVATKGPISVAIDANHPEFMGYSSGVLTIPDCSTTQLDHAVLVVGYGHDEESGKDYWLVKNSWSTQWGEQGYVKFDRADNMCGIQSYAVYPVV